MVRAPKHTKCDYLHRRCTHPLRNTALADARALKTANEGAKSVQQKQCAGSHVQQCAVRTSEVVASRRKDGLVQTDCATLHHNVHVRVQRAAAFAVQSRRRQCASRTCTAAATAARTSHEM